MKNLTEEDKDKLFRRADLNFCERGNVNEFERRL